MPPDYTEQLKAIVAALNHPTTRAWLIALFSAILGMVGGISAQSVTLRLNDRFQRHKMRRVIYTDLGGYFMFMYSTLTHKGYSLEIKLAWQQEQFEKRIKFSDEDFLRRQPDVFMQLNEHRAAEELYLWLHHTVDKTKTGCSNPDMFCQIFSEYVADGFLPEKSFVKYGGKEQTAKLMAKVKEARATLETVKKLVEKGILKTVDGFQPDK